MFKLLINPLLLTIIITIVLAQIIKLIVYYFIEHRWEWTRLLETGGMPSSHSATVAALAMGVGLREGYNSTFFAMAIVLAIVVMYDATGIRREAGFHAQLLNDLIRELHELRKMGPRPEPLKELLGHTYLEVGVGAILGGLIAWICFWFF